MKVLVTGASGYAGTALTKLLASRGYTVHALVRSSSSADTLQHPGIRIFRGDVLNKEDLAKAMKGCEQVYHTAGLVKMWAKDPGLLYRQNVTGTVNVLETAVRESVSRLVFTSTCGLWSSSPGRLLAEDDPHNPVFETEYDRTKGMAERSVKEYAAKGLHTVIANISRIYGPGPDRPSCGINRFTSQILNNRVVLLPWHTEAKGNYAFVEDVAAGLLSAMEKGENGESYILGGENISYKEFTGTVTGLAGCRNTFIRIPTSLLSAWSQVELLRGKLSGHEPLLTPGIVRRLQVDKAFDCRKAIEKLGYRITPFEEGMRITIEELKKRKKKRRADKI